MRKIVKLCFIFMLILTVVFKMSNIKSFVNFQIKQTKDYIFSRKLFMVGILSGRENFEERQAVRNTWINLIESRKGDYKFLIGSKSCDIPTEDRITPYTCERWSPHLPSNVKDDVIFSLTEPTRQRYRISFGFTFIVKHSMTIDMLGISSSLRRGKENIFRVELHDSLRNQKVISASFIMSGFEPSMGFLWKKVPEIVFNTGFEGEIKIISNDDYNNLNCLHKFKTDGVISIFEFVDIKGFYSKFETPVCPIASFLYKINEINKLQQFINESSIRQDNLDKLNENIYKKIIQEEQKHNDLIIVDTVDVYSNLPVKLNHFFQWSTLENKYKYIVKTDDDVFLDVKKITAQLEKDTVWGWWSCFKVGWPPPNAGKWRDMLTDLSTYPKFPSGSGYVLKADMAKNAITKPFTNAGEDVSLGFWLAEYSPIDLIDSICFWACDDKCNKNPCNVPELTATDMYFIWKNYNECGEICNCSKNKIII